MIVVENDVSWLIQSRIDDVDMKSRRRIPSLDVT